MISDLSYKEALGNIERSLAKGKALKADVYIVHFRGGRFVVKDFGQKGFFERNLVGRIVTGRELRAYRALAGIEGLPAQYKRLGPCTIAIEYLEGTDLGRLGPGEIGREAVRQFEAVIEALHARGWVHLDLQRRSNILLVNNKVVVVDLASAFHPGGVPLIGRFLTALLGFADRMSLIKIKNIYAPELLTEKERKWLNLRNKTMPRKW